LAQPLPGWAPFRCGVGRSFLILTWLNSLPANLSPLPPSPPGIMYFWMNKKQNERRNHSQCEALRNALPGALPFWYGSGATNDQRRFEDDSFKLLFHRGNAAQPASRRLSYPIAIGWLRGDKLSRGNLRIGAPAAPSSKPMSEKVTPGPWSCVVLFAEIARRAPGHHFVY